MNWKNYLAVFCACAAAGASSYYCSGQANAAEMPKAAEMRTISVEEYTERGYTHISPRYGYSIVCPKKPMGVVPLSLLDETAKGEILIFSGSGTDISQGWLILINAFEETEIPDLMKSTEEEQKALIKHLMETSGYEFVRIAEFPTTKGVYAVTAKEVEIDKDGDGQADETATSETQMIKTFFRGEHGGRFAVELIDNPELTQRGVAEYQMGLITFKELPKE